MISKNCFVEIVKASIDYYKKLEYLMDNGYGMSVENNIFTTYFDKVLSAVLDTFSENDNISEMIYDIFYQWCFDFDCGRTLNRDLFSINDKGYRPKDLEELYDSFKELCNE